MTYKRKGKKEWLAMEDVFCLRLKGKVNRNKISTWAQDGRQFPVPSAVILLAFLVSSMSL